jgi:hypothetical protein
MSRIHLESPNSDPSGSLLVADVRVRHDPDDDDEEEDDGERNEDDNEDADEDEGYSE